MLFSSIIFLMYFFPIVFAGYYLLSFSRLAQNIWLFIASILFYAWGEPVCVLLMLGSIMVNWGAGILVEKYQDQKSMKKWIMVAACVINIGVLVIFKYTDFLIGNMNMIANRTVVEKVGIRLPIGISFYTFQALSYVIDVYKGDTKAEKNPFYVGLYIAFFPQLVAEPYRTL